MKKKLIKEVMDTLLQYRYNEDNEYGQQRRKQELIEQGSMPECYYKLSKLLGESH